MSWRRNAQPTACRKDEGTRVRRVAPKLSSQTESRITHALERSSPAQGFWIGQSRGNKARSGVESGRRRIGWRRATSEKPTVVRETKGDACVLPTEMQECPRGTWRNAPERSRSNPCAKAARWRVQRSHRRTLSTMSDRARRGRVCGHARGVVHVNRGCEGEIENYNDHTHRGGIVEDRG